MSSSLDPATWRTIQQGITYGIAATRAHAAYIDEEFLTFAENWWNWAVPFAITDDNIASRSFPGKNFTLQTQCKNNSVVGGVFENDSSNPGYVSELTTGSFFVYVSSPAIL
ncbi:hypothetical protein L218DRAFT_947048 [Marasmius fiardii PR-910]|nr:hypothetical protein L218DRAFT_947048 [Marasmius fiardii PR-910]